jgi:hypothetical protein
VLAFALPPKVTTKTLFGLPLIYSTHSNCRFLASLIKLRHHPQLRTFITRTNSIHVLLLDLFFLSFAFSSVRTLYPSLLLSCSSSFHPARPLTAYPYPSLFRVRFNLVTFFASVLLSFSNLSPSPASPASSSSVSYDTISG